MNLSKKLISLSLVACLSMQTVSADVLNSALQNYTPPSQTTMKDSSGNTIKSMYYSGGYYFRFNNTGPNQPLWSLTPPSIEAGCNGFNLKGMFVSLLGLDQFGAMLQNAGTTLAWGVAVGLIYSLPGIFNVFKTINQWAKQIQQLLAMGCQAGIALGQALGEKAWSSIGSSKEEAEKTVTGNLDSSDLATYVQSGVQGVADALGLKGGSFSWESGFSFGGGATIPNDKKAEAFSKIFRDIFVNSSIGGTLLEEIMKKPNGAWLKSEVIGYVNNNLGLKANEVINYKYLQYFYVNNSSSPKTGDILTLGLIDDIVKNVPTLEGKDDIGMKLLSYALFANLAGDFGFSEHTIKTEVEHIKNAMTKLNTDFGDAKATNTMTLEEAQKKVLEEFTNPKPGVATPSQLRINTDVATPIKDFILNGITEENSVINTFYAPRFVIIAGKDKQVTDFFISATSLDTNSRFFYDSKGNATLFPGVKAIAACITYNSFKGIIEEATIEQVLEPTKKPTGWNYNTEIPKAKAACNKYEHLTYADVSIYKDILAKSTASDRKTAFDQYKDIITYAVANSMINQMGSILSMEHINKAKKKLNGGTSATVDMGKPPANSNPNEILNIHQAIALYGNGLREAKKQLDIDYPTGKDGLTAGMSFIEFMKHLERNIQERSSSKQQ